MGRDESSDPDEDKRENEKTYGTGSEHKSTRMERLRTWLTNVQFVAYTTLALLFIVVSILWPRIFVTIPAGSLGVMYRYLGGGTVTDKTWSEGLHVLAPWNQLTPYETRLQQEQMTFDVISKEGLTLGVEVSVRFQPDVEMLGHLHRDIGPDYFNRLIKPEVKAHVRRTFGSRRAYEIFTSARDILQELGQVPSLRRMQAKSATYVYIEELKLLDVKLPPIVEAAIADKYRQEQLMLEYDYKLEREEKEAERKRTEAAGIRDYNIIAGKDVSPNLLRWRGIDATANLANSPNSKVLVLGGGGEGVPFIMNLGEGSNNAGATTSTTGNETTALTVNESRNDGGPTPNRPTP